MHTRFSYVDETEYPHLNYPQFVMGALVLMPSRAVARLLQTASTTPFVHLDDVYFFGLVRNASKISLIDMANINVPPVSSFTATFLIMHIATLK